MSKAKSTFLNLPNSITIARLVSVPILMVLMLYMNDAAADIEFNRMLSFITGLAFAISMSTDMLDGYLARRQGIVTVFGKFADPLADKMVFLVAMIMMIPLGRIPAWLVAIFFIREVAITALRSIAIHEGIIIAASDWGKYKSAFVSVATGALLWHYPFFGVEWRMVGWVLLVPSLAFSIGSGIHYAYGFISAHKAGKRGSL